MKRHVGIISVLIFTIIVLSYSFAAAGFWEDLAKGLEESAKKDTQKKEEAQKKEAQKKKEEEFYKKLDGLLKKLPATAKVAVLEPQMKAPEFETPEPDPEEESDRKKIIKRIESGSEKIKDMLEEHLGELGIAVLDRDIFKDIEKEIIYSQTGEVDQSSSAEFGKKLGATHMLAAKLIYEGFKTAPHTVTYSIKIIEVESAKRIGTINFTQEIDIEQPKESTTSTPQAKKSKAPEPQNLLSEGFSVSPGSYKTYSWDFPNDGTLDIAVKADFDVYVLVTDEINYRIFDSGGTAKLFANKKITSGSFSVSIPRGSHYIIIYNKDSLLTSASVGMVVFFTPR